MKAILGIVILIVLAAGGWYLYDKKSAEKMAQEDAAAKAEMMANDPDGDGDDHMMGTTTDDMMMGTSSMATSSTATSTDMMDSKKSDEAASAPGAPVFTMTGKNFEFSTKEMKVKKGDKVTVNFESSSGFHDWVVDEFKAATKQVNPGTKTSITFVADKTGTFEYYCSVGKHRQSGMVGKLIVE